MSNMGKMTKPDIVIISNSVFTGKQDRPVPRAISIAGNRIMAIASHQAIEPCIGKDTKVYRFNNELVMPGLHDHHVHVFCGSLSQESVWLRDAKSEAAAAERVRRFADKRPDDPWIYGFSWYHAFWENKELPHRSSLDRLLPGRPVFLFNAELHGAWVNSKALELSGITRDKPDPPFGEIARDEKGEPTGFLYETAMGLVSKHAFNLDHNRLVNIFENFLDNAARLGVTSVSDMHPLPGMELGDAGIYREFEEKGKLRTRLHMVASLGDDLEHAREFRERYHSDKLNFSALKQFLDGVHMTYTAYMREPYADRPDTRGITLIPPDVVKGWVIKADKAGFRIRLHACGDGAVKMALDCFEAARKENGRRDARHTIEHIENLYPEDAHRFGELGIVASVQPEHLALTATYAENPYRVRLGQERSKLTWPNKTLLRGGAVLALGSDYPVVEFNPMMEIHRAVTRTHDDGEPKGGWNPGEKLTVAEALRGYTSGPAHATFCEKDQGTLEEGKLADIVVLDQNLFEIEPENILDTKVRLTVMDGKVIFES
jgi:predicted amidohydrolase YtcJ